MSSSMTAQFELTLIDKLSGPLEKIDQIVNGLSTALERLGAQSAFEQAWDPVPRCAEQTLALSEAMDRVSGTGAAAMSEGLERTALAATEAGSALAQATEGTNALDAALTHSRTGSNTAIEALDAVTAAARRAGEAVEAVSMTSLTQQGILPPGDPEEAAPKEEKKPSYTRRVMGAGKHFHEETERGVGKAFGAAIAGLGLIEPVRAAAEYDNTLRHIAIGLDLHGKDADKFSAQFGQQINALARDTGQKSDQLAEAAGFFGREQFSRKDIDAMMPVVAKIATAYNANPEAVAKSTFALRENLGIDNAHLGGALASIALAGKSADLPFEKLAPLLPQLASVAGLFGLKGRSGVDDLAAMTAVVRKSTGTDGEAVTDMKQLMIDLNAGHTSDRLKKYGVDMYGVEDAARHSGHDPLLAIMEKIDKITDHGENTRVMGDLFRNHDSLIASHALLDNFKQYEEIHKRTSGANQKVIDADFADGIRTLKIQVDAFDESWEQLEKRMGIGFAPILGAVTTGFHGLTEAMEWADKYIPGLTTGTFAVAGGLLAITAGMAALGAVSGPVIAGFELIGAVLGGITLAGAGIAVGITAALAVVAAGIYEIYKHWDAVKASFVSFEHWVVGWGQRIGHSIAAPFEWAAAHMPHLGSWGSTPVVMPAGGGAAGNSRTVSPLQVHVSHDPGLRVTAAPHPQMQTRILPAAGRMVNRP